MNLNKKKPTDWREARRLRAIELKQAGWSQSAIAEAFGVTRGAVSQWVNKAENEGIHALLARKATGAPPKLSNRQLQRLPKLLERGPQKWGFRGEVWTRERVASVIERQFGVKYHPSHVGRLLRKAGWTPQKPEKMPNQRDEEKIKQWANDRWPELKKKPDGRAG